MCTTAFAVCAAPCNRVIAVRKDAWYHVEAFAARPTRSFDLYSPQDPVVWLDVKTTDPHEATRAIAGAFEEHLGETFG